MSANVIDHFTGEYAWLSNFAPASIHYDGCIYPTVEHAYQAAKTLDEREKHFIRTSSTAGMAKRYGRRVTMRSDWDQVKRKVMLDLLRLKFGKTGYALKLVKTGDAELIEGNDWGDRYWGVCRGEGENWLGKLLMQVRAELQKE